MLLGGLLAGLLFGGSVGAEPQAESHPEPQAKSYPPPPLWEYGIGLGAVDFEHYPASRQHSTITLPFPTFQYRGPILRADDQEGARVYLWKEGSWAFQFSGGLYPPLRSDDNEARRGMEDIPLRVQLGPQLVSRFMPGWEAKLGLFPSIATDLALTKVSGAQAELALRYDFYAGAHDGRVTLAATAATREFLQTYFEVPDAAVTPERTRFAARAGVLGAELSYFHTYHRGRAAFYFGGGLADYASSANRGSPLHTADRSLTGVVGLTYVLGESAREAVPEEETRGVLPRRRVR